MQKIQSWDTVLVIAGKHKGKVAKVLSVQTKTTSAGVIKKLVFLEGVNIAKKAVKWEGFKDVTLPLDISNVMYYDTSTKQHTKIGIKYEGKKKVRYQKISGSVLS